MFLKILSIIARAPQWIIRLRKKALPTHSEAQFCVIPISVTSVEVLRSQLNTYTAQQIWRLILGHLHGMGITRYGNIWVCKPQVWRNETSRNGKLLVWQPQKWETTKHPGCILFSFHFHHFIKINFSMLPKRESVVSKNGWFCAQDMQCVPLARRMCWGGGEGGLNTITVWGLSPSKNHSWAIYLTYLQVTG